MERMTIRMKKKVMAFAMSVILLVVGMIPGGMCLVNVKAADDSVYVWNVSDNYSATAYTWSSSDVEKYGTDDYFSFTPKSGSTKIASSSKKWEDGFSSSVRLAFGSPEAKLEFTTKGPSELKIWVYDNSAKYTGLYDESGTLLYTFERPTSNNAARIITQDIDNAGTYYLAGVGTSGGGAYIFKVQVTEKATTTTTSYNVTVKDEKAASTEVTNAYEDGVNVTLTAGDAENFLYWVNGIGRVISRSSEVSFPVYYSDTYTAVYKSADTTVNYMTYFGQKYESYTVSELSEEPEGPTRYGYEFDKWSMTVEEIKAAAEAGDKDVEVTPLYREVTETISITVDGTTSSYKKNEVVKADAGEISNFSYWKDETGNVLSYNPVYYFFASKAITITAVKDETVTPEGVVQYLDYIASGTNKSFVFMFTVPEGCHIEFAGIAASSTVTDLTLTSAGTLVRGRASDSTAVRYTWTKTNAASATWNVKPILKYKDANGNLHTIEGSVVSQ